MVKEALSTGLELGVFALSGSGIWSSMLSIDVGVGLFVNDVLVLIAGSDAVTGGLTGPFEEELGRMGGVSVRLICEAEEVVWACECGSGEVEKVWLREASEEEVMVDVDTVGATGR